MHPVILVVIVQALFTTSDLVARHFMVKGGFVLENFFTLWFAFYFGIRLVAMMGQLYIFANVELGKAMALFGAVSIVLANVLGFLLLSEVLTTSEYLGIALAVTSFIILAFTF